MTNALTDARAALANGLAANGVPVSYGTPPTILPNTVALEPGDPYYTPRRVGPRFAGAVTYRATLYVPLVDYVQALADLDSLIARVSAALPDGFGLGPVDRPDTVDTGSQGEWLTTAVPITAHVTE